MRPVASSALLLLLAVGCATEPRSWSVEHESPDAALLSVLATDHGLYVVGADDGQGPVVLRRRGETWERLWTEDRGDLWWVTSDSDGAILMGGEGGRILRYDPVRARIEAQPTPHVATLFGIWVGPDGVAFAVGGDVRAESGRGALWTRRDGVWTTDARVPAEIVDGAVLFKVWGTSGRDVWAVGERGTVLHFDGDAWQPIASPVGARLLTVHGDERGPVMVGGAANGVVLEMSDGALQDRMPAFMPGANGVFVDDAGTAWAVGNRGTVLRRDPGAAWTLDPTVPTPLDLHAVAVDAEGVVWTVGGALLSPSFDQGVVARLGP